MSATDKQLEGEVVITTTDTLARYVLPKLMAKLSRKYRGIRFSLYMANQLSDISNREADIAIRTCIQPPDNLIGRKVGELKFILVASRSYVKKHKLVQFPKELSDQHFIVLNESYSSVPIYQWFNKCINGQGKSTKVNNFLCAAALAREGMGICVLPSYMLAKEPTLVELPIKKRISRNDLWVLSHPDLRDNGKVRVIRQFLYDELPLLLAD